MMLSYSNNQVGILMVDYVKKVIEGSLKTFMGAHLPQLERIYSKYVSKSIELNLMKERAQCFHNIVAQLLFVTMQYRRDIQTAVEFLTTGVKGPDEDDWAKLRQVIKYLHRAVYLSLTLDIS